MDQIERNKVITRFKKKEVPILVATDVAGKNNLAFFLFLDFFNFNFRKIKIRFFYLRQVL